MIRNEVYRLKADAEIAKGMNLPKDQELEIVMDVVYVNGHMVQKEAQPIFYKWITENPNLFKITTKNW